MDLYERAKAAGVEMSNHESDLYLKCGAVADALVKECDTHGNARRFRNQLDGALWWDIPFAYAPWWQKRGCLA